MASASDFPPSGSASGSGSARDLATTSELTPAFDGAGLVSAIVTDAGTGAVLMLAHMNAEALDRTIATGEAHFYSRSRGRLWLKGEESGNVLEVREVRVDCDQDALWLKVRVRGNGVACHTGAKSCFYRGLERGADGRLSRRLVLDTGPDSWPETGLKMSAT